MSFDASSPLEVARPKWCALLVCWPATQRLVLSSPCFAGWMKALAVNVRNPCLYQDRVLPNAAKLWRCLPPEGYGSNSLRCLLDSPAAPGIRQLAHENFLAIISEIDNKDLRLAALTALLKEREHSQARVDKEREKSDIYAKEVIESLRCDVLRAKGLMTARGVFERVGQLVFNEQRCKSKFNCTTGVLQALAKPSAGERSQFLFDTIQDCKDPGDDVNKAATKVWQQLSDQTHGQTWSGIEVEVLGPLDEVGRCVIAKICAKMGLPHTQKSASVWLGSEFGEHRLDRVDIAVKLTTSCCFCESTCRHSVYILNTQISVIWLQSTVGKS